MPDRSLPADAGAAAAAGVAVAADASLLETAVMGAAIVCTGLAVQAARVAILARRQAAA